MASGLKKLPAGQRIVLLHAFVKKTRKAPPADLALARSRKKEVEG